MRRSRLTLKIDDWYIRMISRAVTVTNQLGLHARAAARFVHLATRFASQIRVAREAKVMDGKSIMGILLLAAARGTTITISADGQDEADAVEALVRLVESGFGEIVERLKGIGVSAGLAVGPALVAIQRTQVIRFSDRARPRRARAVGAGAGAPARLTSS